MSDPTTVTTAATAGAGSAGAGSLAEGNASGCDQVVIAVDLDEVIGQFVACLCEFHNTTYGSSHTPDDYISYEFMHVWKCSKDEAQDRVDLFLESQVPNIPVIDGAKDALTTLHGSGKVRLVLVTSRQTAIQEETKQWLDKHFSGLFDEVVFGNHYGRSGVKRSKADMCKALGAKVLIDDRVKYARATTGAVECIVLFGTYAWNTLPPEEEAALHESIHRAADWAAVMKLLKAQYPQLA